MSAREEPSYMMFARSNVRGGAQTSPVIVESLLARIDRLEAVMLDADSMLQETSVTLDGTVGRMHEQAMLPKRERSDDFDRDDLIRYAAYASQAHSTLGRFRSIIAGQG